MAGVAAAPRHVIGGLGNGRIMPYPKPLQRTDVVIVSPSEA
jgi:hypothetical protein